MSALGGGSGRDLEIVLTRARAAVAAGHVIENSALRCGRRFVGKVRDVYTCGDYTVLVR